MPWGLTGNIKGAMGDPGPGLQASGLASANTIATATNNTTLVTGLSVAVAEAGTYRFNAQCYFSRAGAAGTSRGLRLTANYTGTTSSRVFSVRMQILAAVTTSMQFGVTDWQNVDIQRTFTDTQTIWGMVEGWFVATGTGTFQIQFSKQGTTLNDYSLSMIAGSYLDLTRVP